MRIKICGLKQVEQALSIAHLGFKTLGFICVPTSPRYLEPPLLQKLILALPTELETIGVFAHSDLQAIEEVVEMTGLGGIQLHGAESPDFCRRVKELFPQLELIKALRISCPQDLRLSQNYKDCVDTLLLDAYHPHKLGGTGHTLPWETLKDFQSPCPWFLAGGLNPHNITEALQWLSPQGLDLSSGVERSPGDKDLEKVAQLRQIIGTIIKSPS
jgi:phosphoribosylanthranilate isomerase